MLHHPVSYQTMILWSSRQRGSFPWWLSVVPLPLGFQSSPSESCVLLGMRPDIRAWVCWCVFSCSEFRQCTWVMWGQQCFSSSTFVKGCVILEVESSHKAKRTSGSHEWLFHMFQEHSSFQTFSVLILRACFSWEEKHQSVSC